MTLTVASGREFRKFLVGQTISNLGSAFTMFALPLIVFELTDSALSLAFTAVVEYVPYILFGLLIGGWVDRFGTKGVMIFAEVAQAAVISSIPLLAVVGALEVWWVYVAGFVSSTLWVLFNTAEFAALPGLVGPGQLMGANGSLQASYSAATLAGPLIAGALVAFAPVYLVLALDAVSSLVAAAVLGTVTLSGLGNKSALKKAAMQPDAGFPRKTQGEIIAEIHEGIRYVFSRPLLRDTFLMMALINCVGFTIYAQLVLFAKRQLGATDPQVGVLYAAGGAGMILLALAAGPLRHRFSFSQVALGAPALGGLTIVALSLVDSYWAALPLWGLVWGLVILCEINSGTLVQEMVPARLLGRVKSVTSVISMSAVPLGVLAGGFAIRFTEVDIVYLAIGLMVLLISVAFIPTTVGRAARSGSVRTEPFGK